MCSYIQPQMSGTQYCIDQCDQPGYEIRLFETINNQRGREKPIEISDGYGAATKEQQGLVSN